MNEKQWVAGFVQKLEASLAHLALEGASLKASDCRKLPYSYQVNSYEGNTPFDVDHSAYETDILIYDVPDSGKWTPRVVVECKLGSVTTHDALTYSAKAATHKQIHPYLRYGFLASGLDGVPVRLMKHGAYFDFMTTWRAGEPTKSEWGRFCDILGQEVTASRDLHSILRTNRSAGRSKYHTFHRPLLLSKY